MNSSSYRFLLAGGISAIPLVFTLPAAAQDEDLGSMVNKALAAMNAEQWQEGLKWNAAAVERYGQNNPLQLFGPQFGTIYYRKGVCEMKLQKWGDAMASFETCYKDFPNPKDAGARANPFEKKAFMYFDIISWLDSKILKRPIELVTRENAVKRLRTSQNKNAESFPSAL